MWNSIFWVVAVLLIYLLIMGTCNDRTDRIKAEKDLGNLVADRIEVTKDEGFLTTDIHLTNTSKAVYVDTKVTVTVFFNSGESEPLERAWPHWAPSEVKTLNVPARAPVETVEVSGTTTVALDNQTSADARIVDEG